MSTIPNHVHVVHADPAMDAGLYAILAAHADWRVTSEAREPAQRALARVLVADHATGIALARAGAGRQAVLVVSQRDKEWDVRTAMESGVLGYLHQSCPADELAHAVRQLLRGIRYLSEPVSRNVAAGLGRAALTERETDVLHLLAEGYCNKLIARRLGIGVGTVKTHVKGVMSKLDATARTHAVVVAAARGLIDPGRRSAVPAPEQAPVARAARVLQ
ncbi:response regulator transcription factor [uncultured Massilia sp.]|uniref:response regulator transcription factor n=1 Tax=uncultured Massilia sp. TaxID=169973 RepID=UPI0025D1F1C2|nr:response regulator transcription factor [uncultured Massilia sp.]